MKKILTTMVLGMTLVFGVQTASAAQFTSEQIAVIAQVLLADDQFTPEQIVQIITILSLQDETSSSSGDFVLPIGKVCDFRYTGDESIIAIQQELQNQGYTITKVDGKIGPETRAAVEAFQTANKAQKVDGLIGQEVRSLLMKTSLLCLGDEGVVPNPEPETFATIADEANMTEHNAAAARACVLTYNGHDSVVAVQQALKDQGYTITKVDGKIGPETRAAVEAFQTANKAQKVDGLIGQEVRVLLARNSMQCSSLETTSSDVGVNSGNTSADSTTIEENETGQNTNITVSDEVVVVDNSNVVVGANTVDTPLNAFVVKDEVLSAVRSSRQIVDDTAVFTYRMTLNPDQNIFISTNPDVTFGVNIYNQQGNLVNTETFTSVVSSAEKILRDDRMSYYRIKKGDTMSLRATAQPGPDVYYAELGRFTYTTQNAQTVLNPEVENYGLDPQVWRSGSITLQN